MVFFSLLSRILCGHFSLHLFPFVPIGMCLVFPLCLSSCFLFHTCIFFLSILCLISFSHVYCLVFYHCIALRSKIYIMYNFSHILFFILIFVINNNSLYIIYLSIQFVQFPCNTALILICIENTVCYLLFFHESFFFIPVLSFHLFPFTLLQVNEVIISLL